MTTPGILEFKPLTSCIHPSFWSKLTELKLDFDGVTEKIHTVWGYYTNFQAPTSNVDSTLDLDSTSYNSEPSSTKLYLPMCGRVLNKNTIEQFKECDKVKLINEEGNFIWQLIKDAKALANPSILNSFFVLSFADIKKYHYYYWFAFPVPANLIVTKNIISNASDFFDEPQLLDIYNKYHALSMEQKTFFLIKQQNSGTIEVLTLKELNTDLVSDLENRIHFAFSDTSTSENYPGWPLRNYIALILHHCPNLENTPVNFVAIRLSRNGTQLNCKNSLIFSVTLPNCEGNVENLIFKDANAAWVGWETNERGKCGPRMCNMRNSLDPVRLAESAVYLNLKLMKWRLLPNINLDVIKDTKCLLLGAGTLGCSVARTLLGWGVRNITFVDSSTVSFSNPVRQNLFTYDDCVKHKPKAEAAAERLKEILPSVNSIGYNFHIPMPGHVVGESLLERTKESVDLLTKLIGDNDVVFLLMDSRESRWLPTLLGNFLNKIVINAALGFDTFVVMRHGVHNKSATTSQIPNTEGVKHINGENLGCYFCTDVTAPGNSLKDRSLDQQCTVTRPGVSPIAGALAVELAVSILQHKDGILAPAFLNTTQESSLDLPNECVLGILPHSIRGFLATFSVVLPAVERYKQCVACSRVVIDEYEKKGFEFLLQVFNSSKYLEELTGLKELYEQIDQEQVWELSDGDLSSSSN